MLVIDNAPYHQGMHLKKALQEWRIPTIYTGPYSFDAAPVERVFALLKKRIKESLLYSNINEKPA